MLMPAMCNAGFSSGRVCLLDPGNRRGGPGPKALSLNLDLRHGAQSDGNNRERGWMRERGGEIGRVNEWERDRERQRERKREIHRQRKRERVKVSERDRERGRERRGEGLSERETERERDRERQRETERERGRGIEWMSESECEGESKSESGWETEKVREVREEATQRDQTDRQTEPRLCPLDPLQRDAKHCEQLWRRIEPERGNAAPAWIGQVLRRKPRLKCTTRGLSRQLCSVAVKCAGLCREGHTENSKHVVLADPRGSQDSRAPERSFVAVFLGFLEGKIASWWVSHRRTKSQIWE